MVLSIWKLLCLFILCVCILTTRCCLWKDPSAVPRMGCAWSFCRKYFVIEFFSHVKFFFLRSNRGIALFSQLALRAAPSYQSFSAALVSQEGDELKSGFISSMHRDLGVYLPAMERHLAILDVLYEEYDLESDEVVWRLGQSDDAASTKGWTRLQGQSRAWWRTATDATSASEAHMKREHVLCQCNVIPVVFRIRDSKGTVMSYLACILEPATGNTRVTLWFDKL